MTGPRVRVAPTGEEAAALAAGLIAAQLEALVRQSGSASFFLAGGSTPAPAYRLLARDYAGALDWDKVTFYFGDERMVSWGHPQSNYRQARENLLEPLGVKPGNIFPIRTDAPADQAAAEYRSLLPDQLGLLLLGVGQDGHTASIFPGSFAAREQNLLVVAVHDAPKPPPDRVTVTPLAIRSAASLMALAVGESKARAVKHALLGRPDPEAVPASLAQNGTWVLDRAAYAFLEAGLENQD